MYSGETKISVSVLDFKKVFKIITMATFARNNPLSVAVYWKKTCPWTILQTQYIMEDNSLYCILINVSTLQDRYKMAFV